MCRLITVGELTPYDRGLTLEFQPIGTGTVLVGELIAVRPSYGFLHTVLSVQLEQPSKCTLDESIQNSILVFVRCSDSAL